VGSFFFCTLQMLGQHLRKIFAYLSISYCMHNLVTINQLLTHHSLEMVLPLFPRSTLLNLLLELHLGGLTQPLTAPSIL